MGLSLINQGNESIGILLIGVKFGFVNFRLSMSQCFDYKFQLKYRNQVKPSVLKS
jgi:hypothetical protein